MKCPKCGKRMKKLADEYDHFTKGVKKNIKAPVYRCLYCGEMKYEM